MFRAGLLAAALVLSAAGANGGEAIDATTLAAIQRVATEGYQNPDAAEIDDVQPSKDPSGRGYCGGVTIEEIPDFMTNFHVRLAGDGQPATLIRLYDIGSPDFSPAAQEAHRMMREYGCID